PSNFVPRPAGNPIGCGTFLGFNGLDQLLEAIAPTGFPHGNNGQLAPPDQGLAVGNGFVVETINNAIAIFDTQGNLFGFESMSAFFGLLPTFMVQNGQVAPPFGPFLSDPRAHYDSVNGHFFVTELAIAKDPNTGNFGRTAQILIDRTQSTTTL